MRPSRSQRKHRHPHHDAPDTDPAFRRLVQLEPGRRRDALRQEIVCAWMPMSSRLARQFRNRGENLEDLEHVAHLGLVKAVSRYDPAHGTAFAAFAVPTIVGEVKRHFRDHTWDMHVPRRVQELRNRVRIADQELSRPRGGEHPSVEQLAEHTGLTAQEVRSGLEARDSYSLLSLDAAATDTDGAGSLVDTLGVQDRGYDRIVEREAVRSALQELPDREKRILFLRFFDDLTQRRIAERLGVSQMQVSRLISQTCEHLRACAESDRAAA